MQDIIIKKKGISLLMELKKMQQEKIKKYIKRSINPCEFYAEKIYNAIKEIGTDDKVLIRFLSSK